MIVCLEREASWPFKFIINPDIPMTFFLPVFLCFVQQQIAFIFEVPAMTRGGEGKGEEEEWRSF
jgi:hypothetical protein